MESGATSNDENASEATKERILESIKDTATPSVQVSGPASGNLGRHGCFTPGTSQADLSDNSACDKRVVQLHSLSPSHQASSGPRKRAIGELLPLDLWQCVFTFLDPRCLGRLLRDTELYLSPDSALICALSYGLFGPSLDYVPAALLRDASLPPGLHLTKYFFRPQLERTKTQLNELRALGPAAVEERMKGMGQERLEDATRFEQWELNGGFEKVVNVWGSAPPCIMTTGNVEIPGLGSEPTPLVEASQKKCALHRSPYQTARNLSGLGELPHLPLPLCSPAPGQTTSQSRPVKDPQDANRMKAERRAEIERRCLRLDPPIQPSTLLLMDAFKAAIQIPMALNDSAWTLLKSRILIQKADAEAKERAFDRATQSLMQSEQAWEVQDHDEVQSLDSNHTADHSHQSVRDKTTDYAEALITKEWDRGSRVNMKNVPRFAAEVLLYVRQRFREDYPQPRTFSAQDEQPYSYMKGHEVPRLKLEHMKWVYDVKVKPIAERFRKDLFLCHACDIRDRPFGFEAVIQHYAAVHTNTLSRRQAVVNWKADWPDESPFDPQPDFAQIGKATANLPNARSPWISQRSWKVPPTGFQSPQYLDDATSRFPVDHASVTNDRLPFLRERSTQGHMLQVQDINSDGKTPGLMKAGDGQYFSSGPLDMSRQFQPRVRSTMPWPGSLQDAHLHNRIQADQYYVDHPISFGRPTGTQGAGFAPIENVVKRTAGSPEDDDMHSSTGASSMHMASPFGNMRIVTPLQDMARLHQPNSIHRHMRGIYEHYGHIAGDYTSERTGDLDHSQQKQPHFSASLGFRGVLRHQGHVEQPEYYSSNPQSEDCEVPLGHPSHRFHLPNHESTLQSQQLDNGACSGYEQRDGLGLGERVNGKFARIPVPVQRKSGISMADSEDLRTKSEAPLAGKDPSIGSAEQFLNDMEHEFCHAEDTSEVWPPKRELDLLERSPLHAGETESAQRLAHRSRTRNSQHSVESDHQIRHSKRQAEPDRYTAQIYDATMHQPKRARFDERPGSRGAYITSSPETVAREQSIVVYDERGLPLTSPKMVYRRQEHPERLNFTSSTSGHSAIASRQISPRTRRAQLTSATRQTATALADWEHNNVDGRSTFEVAGQPYELIASDRQPHFFYEDHRYAVGEPYRQPQEQVEYHDLTDNMFRGRDGYLYRRINP